MFPSILGLYPLDASRTALPHKVVATKMSPGIAKCPWGDREGGRAKLAPVDNC